MNVKKNMFVEEWNGNLIILSFSTFTFHINFNIAGKREITEKTFEYDSNTIPTLIATYVGNYNNLLEC